MISSKLSVHWDRKSWNLDVLIGDVKCRTNLWNIRFVNFKKSARKSISNCNNSWYSHNRSRYFWQLKKKNKVVQFHDIVSKYKLFIDPLTENQRIGVFFFLNNTLTLITNFCNASCTTHELILWFITTKICCTKHRR